MKILKGILSLYEEINDIYLNMCVEVINRSSDKSFDYLLNELQEKIKEEKKLLNKLLESDDYDKIKSIILLEDSPSILRLNDYIKTYEMSNIKIEEDDDELTIESKNISMKMFKLMFNCTRNIFLVYASFLDEYIKNTNNDEIRERLLTIKFYNSFTKHDIEDVLLKYQFNVPLENYVDVYLVAETLGIDLNECDETILNSYLAVIEDMISQLMLFGDEKYSDYNNLAVIGNASFMLQACFALMSEKDYLDNEQNIFDNIESLKNENNGNSARLIYEIIRCRKSCQKRVRKISMRSTIS